MPIGGVIINRVHQADAIADETSYSLTESDVAAIAAAPDLRLGGVDLTHRLLAAYRDQLTLAALDRAAIEATDWSRAALPVHRVPHFDRDLHSLADIAAVAACLQRAASVDHRNRGDVTFGHREHAGPNPVRAGKKLDLARPNDLLEAQPAHRNQTAPDRFRRSLHQRERARLH